MDIGTIGSLISTIGFPVACCLGMGWYINKIEDRHREDVNKMMEVIQNNTVALTQLTDRIENVETIVKDVNVGGE